MRRIQRAELFYDGVLHAFKEHADHGWEGYDPDDWMNRAATFRWLLGEMEGKLFEVGSIMALLKKETVDPSKFEIKLSYIDTEYQNFDLCARCGRHLTRESDPGGPHPAPNYNFAGICWTCIKNQINERDKERAGR